MLDSREVELMRLRVSRWLTLTGWQTARNRDRRAHSGSCADADKQTFFSGEALYHCMRLFRLHFEIFVGQRGIVNRRHD